MPTVTATLKMFDAMTKPLQQITNSMNLMIRSMEQMQSAANRNLKVDRTLVAAKKQLVAAEAGIRQSIDAAKQAQDKFNQSVRNTKPSTDSLASSIKKYPYAINGIAAPADGKYVALYVSAWIEISAYSRFNLSSSSSRTLRECVD